MTRGFLGGTTMRNWKKHAAVIAVAAPLALFAPACSHSSENTQPDEGTETTTPPPSDNGGMTNPNEMPDAGTMDDGMGGAGTDQGTMNQGTPDEGTPDQGTMDNGTGGSGMEDAGTMEQGTDSSGATDSSGTNTPDSNDQ
jgi:hypothetical protein